MRENRGSILVIEDEPSVADSVTWALETEGFKPIWRTSGREALEIVRAGGVSLVVLDVGLPDVDGFELCREIRGISDVPVIFLTARSEEVDRVVGLELGGDDYVSKPFSPRELTARIKAVLRRTAAPPGGNPCPAAGVTGHFTVDRERYAIRLGGTDLGLTRCEYRLLETLISRPGRVFTREQLMAQAWDEPEASMDRTVDAHIKNIRRKLELAREGSGDAIRTHRGLGYSLTDNR